MTFRIRALIVLIVLAVFISAVAAQAGSDGALDPAFGSGGTLVDSAMTYVSAMIVDKAGTLWVAGPTSTKGVAVSRRATSGGVDPAFNGGSPVVLPAPSGATSGPEGIALGQRPDGTYDVLAN